MMLEHRLEMANGRRIGIDDHRRQGVKCFVVEPLHEHDGGCLRGGAAQENRSFDDTHRLQEKPKTALNPKKSRGLSGSAAGTGPQLATGGAEGIAGEPCCGTAAGWGRH